MTKAWDNDVHYQLQTICLDLPETTEVSAWGHPNFKAGRKTFAVLETYKGELSIAVKVTSERQQALLKDPRFYETPYVGPQGWVSLRVHKGPLDWKMIHDLVLSSYRLVALSRMLKQLASR